MVAYATVAYPLIGSVSGHAYPAAPVFGVAPCPTTIFTFGILLLSLGPAPWWLLVIPGLWALVGTSAALQLGIREDLGLPGAALISVAFALLPALRPRFMPRSGREATRPPSPGGFEGS